MLRIRHSILTSGYRDTRIASLAAQRALFRQATLNHVYYGHQKNHAMTTTTPSKIPSPKEIAIICALGALASAIVFSIPWWPTQFLPIWYVPYIYAIVIVFVAPLISLYLDHKNPLVNSQARDINTKKLTTATTVAIVSSAYLIATLLAIPNASPHIIGYAFAIAVMVVIPLASLYFDYYKSLKSGSSEGINRVTISLISTIGILGIAFVYYQSFMSIPQLPASGILAIAITFVVPLISLYFDYKNIKNKKPSRVKTILTMGVSLLLVLSVVASALLQLALYL
jgi:hypothetical protein